MLFRFFSVTFASVIVSCAAQAATIGDQASADALTTKPKSIIAPEKEVVLAKSAAIDDEKFELGIFTGVLAVEDFSSNKTLGLSLSYHISPRWMVQFNYADATVDRSATERQNETDFLIGDRDVSYYHFLAAYRLLSGRSFLGKNNKYNSDLYFLSGLGSVALSDDDNASVVIGTSYRVVLTDALVANLDFRGHSVRRSAAGRNFLDDGKRTFNSELALGINLLF
ncbi:MAG: outer membrane beta-barrel domain-containing protein [Cellvibrionaceae bacterium]|nr:outer membrane beta-barrel domain-containing protein [Cellvibrionaceae bacterium]